MARDLTARGRGFPQWESTVFTMSNALIALKESIKIKWEQRQIKRTSSEFQKDSLMSNSMSILTIQLSSIFSVNTVSSVDARLGLRLLVGTALHK